MSKSMDEINQKQQKCKALLDELNWVEEEFYWHNKQGKRLNDYLEEVRSGMNDVELQNLILEKESLVCQRNEISRDFFAEFRKEVGKIMIETERQRERIFGEYNVTGLAEEHKK